MDLPPRLKTGALIYVLYPDTKWYIVSVGDFDKNIGKRKITRQVDGSSSMFNITNEHFRPNHECDSYDEHSPYWALNAPEPLGTTSNKRPSGSTDADADAPKNKLDRKHKKTVDPEPAEPLRARLDVLEKELLVDPGMNEYEDSKLPFDSRLTVLENALNKYTDVPYRIQVLTNHLAKLEKELAQAPRETIAPEDTEEEDDEEELIKCIGCDKMVESIATNHTTLLCYYKLLNDPTVNKSNLDMKHIAEKRITQRSVLFSLGACYDCINNPGNVKAFLCYIKDHWQCQWCRKEYSRYGGGNKKPKPGEIKSGYDEKLCRRCTDNMMTPEFLNIGFRPLSSLLLGIDADTKLEKTMNGGVMMSLGTALLVTIEFDTDEEGKVPEYDKDKANIESLSKLTDDEKVRVHIRINLSPATNRITPITRLLALRDLLVMLHRMFSKSVFLVGKSDPLFYLFYEPYSKLIDIKREPYIVHSAVSLPTSELDQEPRRFADWECMMDPLLPHLSNADLLLEKRVALDKL